MNNILITGTSTQGYEHLGNIIHHPLIRIEEIKPNPLLEQELKRLHAYDWIVFTSWHSVQMAGAYCTPSVVRRLCLCAQGHHAGVCNMPLPKVAAVGKTTAAELKKHGITANLVPEIESSQGLLQAFAQMEPKRALLPRSAIGLPVLPDGLRALGWEVTVVPIYDNVPNNDLPLPDLNQIDTIVFTSPSCVRNFVYLYGAIPAGKHIICRGEETRKCLHDSDTHAPHQPFATKQRMCT